MNCLELKNIQCKYNKYKVLNNISFKINKGDIISVLGGMATGKSTLAKFLGGNFKYSGSYYINGVEIVKENKYLVNRFVDVITLGFNDNRLVVDVLFSALDGKNISNNEEENIVNKYIKQFNIDYANKKMSELEYSKYIFTLIVASFIKEVEYIVLDDVLCYLDNSIIDKIMNYVKENKISIINLTSNINEILYSNYAYFLYEGSVVMEGEIMSCLREEKLLKRLGFNLPFMIDLSTQLMYYNVLNKICFDEKEMVDAIWN